MDAVYEHEVEVRYRDFDTHGHVNNVVYGTYFEEARVAWVEQARDIERLDEFSVVVASIELEFHRPVTTRGPLVVETRLTDLGRSSYTLSYRVLDDGQLMAEGESTQVYVDPELGDPCPIPDSWRTAFESIANAGD